MNHKIYPMKAFVYQFLMLFSSIGILNSQSLTSSLSACYDFNGNAQDMASALHGTVFNASLTTGHNSGANSAYVFNGTAGSYIKLPNSSFLKNTNAMSFAGWVKVNNFQLNDHIIFTKNNASSMFAAYSLITTGSGSTYRFRAYKENGSTSHYAESTSTITLNTWYHVAATIDNAAIKLYINGVLQHTVAVTIPFDYDPTREVILGGTNDINYNTPFNGAIDNLKFYRRVLTANEVSTLYTQDPSCYSFFVPDPGFTVSDTNGCVYQPIMLTDTSTNNPTQWTWNAPGAVGSNSTTANPTFTYMMPGIYTVSLTVANASGSSTNVAVKNITINPQPTVTAVSTKTLICKGEAVTLIAGGASTYSWAGVGFGQTVTVSPLLQTTYVVTGEDQNDCVSTATVQVKVSTCIGIAEESRKLNLVYPNPVNNLLFVELNNKGSDVARVYSSSGQLAKVFDLSNGVNRLSVEELPAGMYILVFESTAETKTFIKN